MDERCLCDLLFALGDDEPFAMFSQKCAELVNNEMLNDHRYSLLRIKPNNLLFQASPLERRHYLWKSAFQPARLVLSIATATTYPTVSSDNLQNQPAHPWEYFVLCD